MGLWDNGDYEAFVFMTCSGQSQQWLHKSTLSAGTELPETGTMLDYLVL